MGYQISSSCVTALNQQMMLATCHPLLPKNIVGNFMFNTETWQVNIFWYVASRQQSSITGQGTEGHVRIVWAIQKVAVCHGIACKGTKLFIVCYPLATWDTNQETHERPRHWLEVWTNWWTVCLCSPARCTNGRELTNSTSQLNNMQRTT